MFDVEAILLRPAVWLSVPLQRHAGMALVDAGVGEGGQKPLDLRAARHAEQFAGEARHIGLPQHMGRGGRGEGGKADGLPGAIVGHGY